MLRDGDLIKIGRTIFKFLTGGNIENAYHEEIYRLTTIDGLTQIYNKRYFLETIEREIARSQRYRRSLSLVMFDIDHFKKINDSYGHLAGDYVLKHLASTVKTKIRREDLFARYGGEEFAIVLARDRRPQQQGVRREGAPAGREAGLPFENTRIQVTISMGVGSIDDEHADAATLIKQADEFLYEAKSAGRNRVCA